METWQDAQNSEVSFWGTCANTYGEETKQFLYFERMGFRPYHDGNSPFAFDGQQQSYLDVGGGPCSMLLKFNHALRRVVVDPCQYPPWIASRYSVAGIELYESRGEDMAVSGHFDHGLIYNVLQHADDPERIVRNTMRLCTTVHMFEWLDIPPHPGHPHLLKLDDLESWLGRKGRVEVFSGRNECYGRAFVI